MYTVCLNIILYIYTYLFCFRIKPGKQNKTSTQNIHFKKHVKKMIQWKSIKKKKTEKPDVVIWTLDGCHVNRENIDVQRNKYQTETNKLTELNEVLTIQNN